MDLKLKANIDDSRMSDGLLAAMNAINRISEVTDEQITLDFSEVGFVTPLYVLPLVVFLNGCRRNIAIAHTGEYLRTIGFPKGMYPDRMRRSEFLAVRRSIPAGPIFR